MARSNTISDRGFVVVTGTSTGVGAATARHLAENGFHVFAGVRRTEDGAALRAEDPEHITPLILDVTDGTAIAAAATTVAAAVGAPRRQVRARVPP